MLDKIKEGMKSVSTLLSGIIVAVLAFGIDEPLAKYLAITAVILGAVITWATPNQPTPEQKIINAAGAEALDGRTITSNTYEDLGGKPFDIAPTDLASGTPETTPLYQPGETEGELYGDQPEYRPEHRAGVSGNDDDLPDPSRPAGLG